MFPRNAATPPRLAIGAVVQISDGAVQTAGVSISVTPEGGAEAAGTGAISYIQGVVHYAPVQSETNYTAFTVTAYKTGCIPVSVTIVTTASATAGKADVGSIGGQAVGLSSDNRLQVDVQEWNDVPLSATNNLDAAVSSRSSHNAAAVITAMGNGSFLTSCATATGFAVPGDAMTLTAGERLAVAGAMEAAIINELDGTAVMQAIADLIASDMSTTDLTVQAIAAAVRDAILNRILAGNHDGPGTPGKLLQDASTFDAASDGVRLANGTAHGGSSATLYLANLTLSSVSGTPALVIENNGAGHAVQIAAYGGGDSLMLGSVDVEQVLADLKTNTDKVDTALQADGSGGWQLTVLALANAPTGGGGGGDATLANQQAIIASLDAVKGDTFNGATDALDKIRDALPTGAGTGANLVTVTINDGTNPLEGAKIRATLGAQSWLSQPTNASGVSQLNLDDGTWTISITLPGYQIAPQSLVVPGADPTYSMTLVVLAPSEPNQVTGYLRCYDVAGVAQAAVSVTIEVDRTDEAPAPSGIAHDAGKRTATSDVNGLVQWTNLFPGLTYIVQREDGVTGRRRVTIPATAVDTYELPSIIG